MFGKKNETNDRYYEGLGTGEAKAYAMISEIIETNKMEDPKAVLLAIKITCEHELRDNPHVREVTFFKRQIKEL